MYRYLRSFFIFLLFASSSAIGQGITDTGAIDSTTIKFGYGGLPNFIPDTSSTPLWQIGHSPKPFFNLDTGTTAIMTDTTINYPANADNSFILKVKHGYNTQINFWHRYQTDSTHAGGIVEFSLDHGVTWQNVRGDCNIDSSTFFWDIGVRTSGFYTAVDTLISGTPAFTGTSNGNVYSQLQVNDPLPEKTTSGGFSCIGSDTFYVRFRFVSDTTTDTLAGWVIDSIKTRYFQSGGGYASNMRKHASLPVSPNPSYSGTFLFPAIKDEHSYTIEVFNSTGLKVLSTLYKNTLVLTEYPPGLYFYKVTNGTDYYSGKLFFNQ